MKKNTLLLAFMLGILTFSSCKKETDEPIVTPLGKYEGGAFIINEGNFNLGNGSISYYNPSTDEMTPAIFQLENNRNLGDVVQSMTIIGDRGFISVNNSNKIEVVNYKDFSEQGVINHLPIVRFIAEGISNTAYVSMWGNGGQVKVINTNTLSIVDSVMVGDGPEGIIYAEQKMFVANSGGFDVDNTVSVISVNNNEVVKTIQVGYSPKQFVRDATGMIWVLCAGAGSWSSVGTQPSSLVQIDPKSLEIIQEIALFADLQPGSIGIDKTGTVVVIGGGYGVNGLYKILVNNPEPPTTPFIDGYFYGFNVSPTTGEIFIADAGDYTNNGIVYRYNFLGNKLGEYEAGIIPNGAAF